MPPFLSGIEKVLCQAFYRQLGESPSRSVGMPMRTVALASLELPRHRKASVVLPDWRLAPALDHLRGPVQTQHPPLTPLALCIVITLTLSGKSSCNFSKEPASEVLDRVTKESSIKIAQAAGNARVVPLQVLEIAGAPGRN